MKLWRVAGKDGKGFYYTEVKPGITMSQAVSKAIDRDIGMIDEQHPHPNDDGIPDVEDHHRFAFSSMGQLYNWFDPEMFSASCKQGAMLEVWEVDSRYVKFGQTQVCFEQDKAKRIKVTRLEKHKLRR